MPENATDSALCRNCDATFQKTARCHACGSPRVISNPEIFSLAIAHIDCDAFYASVEKRDNPMLRDKPVIVGGGRRGVVTTACYIARIRGVRSAMPMFQALKLCPEAHVIKGRMSVYQDVSRQIRSVLDELSPQVEQISIDEAFVSLEGTERLHRAPPAVMLARLARRIQSEIGITISVGLSHNKSLAKIASDLNKPNGFSIIGKAETVTFLRDKPVRLLSGVGAVAQGILEKAGIRTFGDIQRWEKQDLEARFGSEGTRLWHFSRGEDFRRISPNAPAKSITNETTFSEDTQSREVLDGHLWRLAEKVSSRLKAKDLAGRVVTLKLKRANHSTLSRRHTLREPTQLADRIYREARHLLDAVGETGPFRLIGVGVAQVEPSKTSENLGDLLDPGAAKREGAERASDKIRKRFGDDAIIKGRALR